MKTLSLALALLLAYCTFCESAAVNLALTNQQGVKIASVPCISLPGSNGNPRGAYWDDKWNKQHSFTTSPTNCSNSAILSFATITGFDSNRGCPESYKNVIIRSICVQLAQRL